MVNEVTLSADLEEEIEVVVKGIFGEEAVRVEHPCDDLLVRIFVDLSPRVEQGAALVSVTLAIDLPRGYPASASPLLRVERSRGLGDSALAALLAVGASAAAEHGCQEIGCVSQILNEVQEALDAANESTECSICLAPCSPGQVAVRAPCEHIFHSLCIGIWSTLKAQEADEEASLTLQSVKAERDALRREIGEAECREFETTARVEAARVQMSVLSQRVDYERACLRGEEVDSLPLEDGLEVDGEPPTIEQLAERLQLEKRELQLAQAEARRSQTRCVELRKRLETLEESLAVEAVERATQSLPCPVCRRPIGRELLPTSRALAELELAADAQHKGRCMSARVDALPPDLRSQVRRLQAGHQAILERRRKLEEAERVSGASETVGPSTGSAEVVSSFPPCTGTAAPLPQASTSTKCVEPSWTFAQGVAEASASSNAPSSNPRRVGQVQIHAGGDALPSPKGAGYVQVSVRGVAGNCGESSGAWNSRPWSGTSWSSDDTAWQWDAGYTSGNQSGAWEGTSGGAWDTSSRVDAPPKGAQRGGRWR